MNGNYLEFRDYFQLNTNPLLQLKDDYAGAFKPLGQRMETGADPATNGAGSGSGLYARMIATHAGIIINNRMYRPDKMKDGTGTFTAPFLKPVLLHHQSVPGFGEGACDPIGRVSAARYVDTSQTFRDSLIAKKGDLHDIDRGFMDRIADFANGRLSLQDAVDVAKWLVSDAVTSDIEYTGLGHIDLILNITDENAVAKFLDKRYLTGSVGARTDAAVCSICKQDWVKDGFCDHEPGHKYDGILCFTITGNLSYGEFSIVNMPADPGSQVLELSFNGDFKHREITNAQDSGSKIFQIPWQVMTCTQEGAGTFELHDSEGSASSPDTQTLPVADTAPVDNTNISTEENVPAIEPVSSVVQDSKDIEVEATETSAPDVENSEASTSVELCDIQDLLNRLFTGEQLSDDDCYSLYLHMTDGFETKKQDINWDQLSEEMEGYANGLDGEDETLSDVNTDSAKPGGSNAGEYKKSDGPFCGPSGGAPKGTYPVGTKKRARAALAYARHAPNPAGIRKCVCRHWPDLPACKQGKAKDFLDNMRLSREELNSLPRSKFCGPFKTFPVTDLSHYFAAIKMLGEIKGELRDTVLTKVERKGKALGFIPHIELPSQDAQPAFDVSTVIKIDNLSQDQLKSVMDYVSKFLKDNTCGCTDIKDLERENDLLMQEVIDLEDQLGELHDRINVLELKYDAALHDVHSQQDRQIDDKVQMRDLKARYLKLLNLVTKCEKKEVADFINLTEDVLDVSIVQAEGIIDIEKISSKLDDGMARVPSNEIVENPVMVDSGSQVQKKEAYAHLHVHDKKQLADIERKYHTLLYTKGAGVAKAYIVSLQKQGILPKETKED